MWYPTRAHWTKQLLHSRNLSMVQNSVAMTLDHQEETSTFLFPYNASHSQLTHCQVTVKITANKAEYQIATTVTVSSFVAETMVRGYHV